MREVLADTLYWIACVRPRDAWHEPSRDAVRRLGRVRLVTTHEILNEFLTAFGGSGPVLRQRAVETVQFLLRSPDHRVISQSRESFLRAVERYAARGDKSYSLTDCASMNVVDAGGIREVLTNDRHFEQEGYEVLIKAT